MDEKLSLINEPKTPLELARLLYDLAQHGDYANGNVVGGIDEGCVLADRILRQYQVRLEAFEQMTGRVQNRRTVGVIHVDFDAHTVDIFDADGNPMGRYK
jgi:hypothetical protein